MSVFVVSTDGASTKMEQNNVFTVAKRKVDGQDMVYQSLKFTNGLWALAELKIKPGSSTIGVSQFVLLEKALHTLMRIFYALLLSSLQSNREQQTSSRVFTRPTMTFCIIEDRSFDGSPAFLENINGGTYLSHPQHK